RDFHVTGVQTCALPIFFKPKKRLKVGTFKVISNGVRLGERFMKIIFDNALARKVDEIYVTIFEKRDEQQRLIALLEEWGFQKYRSEERRVGKASSTVAL